MRTRCIVIVLINRSKVEFLGAVLMCENMLNYIKHKLYKRDLKDHNRVFQRYCMIENGDIGIQK